MQSMAQEDPNNKLTTGILAQVWRMQPTGNRRADAATLRLFRVEYRLERAYHLLQKIEQRAHQAKKDIANTERRFNTLRDSFFSLQKEWRAWKRENDKE